MKKLILFNVLLLFFGLKTFAQAHLKEVQTTSVWAPANVKIDGNIKEWEESFQAFNKTTKLFYTLSNNDKYLYLAVYCTDAGNNTKIIAGGITFTINTAGRKKDKDAYTITFPVVARRGRGQRGAGGGFGGGGFGGGRGGARTPNGGSDTAAIAAAHKQLIASSKEIKVFGFKAIDDTLISIYNEYGIKTAIGFDNLGNYEYELAIPLQLLNLSPNGKQDIAYNIKVNGLQLDPNIMAMINRAGGEGGGGFGGGGAGGGGGFGGGGRGGAPGGGGPPPPPGGFGGGDRPRGNLDMADLTSPTDFWGKYTLAKQ